MFFFFALVFNLHHLKTIKVKIKLPDEKVSDIELDVTENNFLDCRSSK
jgi:hypothetical protein